MLTGVVVVYRTPVRIVCVRLFKKNQHTLKYMSLFFKIHQGQFEIDGNLSFIDHILEDKNNLYLLAWVHKVICLTLGTILLCLHQLPFLK